MNNLRKFSTCDEVFFVEFKDTGNILYAWHIFRDNSIRWFYNGHEIDSNLPLTATLHHRIDEKYGRVEV